jgi:hypothetical protein
VIDSGRTVIDSRQTVIDSRRTLIDAVDQRSATMNIENAAPRAAKSSFLLHP